MHEHALTEYAPPKPRLTGDERRRTILHAARAEFARVGYYGSSTASIARAAGCSEPMLYKHFAGKLDLFMQSIVDVLDRALANFDSAAVDAVDVHEQGRRHLERMMTDPDYLQLNQLRRIAVNVDEPAVRDLLLNLDDRLRERVGLAIEEGLRQGVTRDDIDAEFIAFCWLGMMQAAAYRERLVPGEFAASRRHVEKFFELLRR